ncbi:MAG: hypothetical protein ACRDXE_07025 [Acidimicrobiales bacterium]
MPTKQRVGFDEEAPTLAPWEQASQTGEQGPVCWLECGRADLATKDGNFVTEHNNLDGKLAMVPTGKPEQLGHAKKE